MLPPALNHCMGYHLSRPGQDLCPHWPSPAHRYLCLCHSLYPLWSPPSHLPEGNLLGDKTRCQSSELDTQLEDTCSEINQGRVWGSAPSEGQTRKSSPFLLFPAGSQPPGEFGAHRGLRKREETWALAGDSSQLHSCKKKPTPKISKPMKVSESILLRQDT